MTRAWVKECAAFDQPLDAGQTDSDEGQNDDGGGTGEQRPEGQAPAEPQALTWDLHLGSASEGDESHRGEAVFLDANPDMDSDPIRAWGFGLSMDVLTPHGPREMDNPVPVRVLAEQQSRFTVDILERRGGTAVSEARLHRRRCQVQRRVRVHDSAGGVMVTVHVVSVGTSVLDRVRPLIRARSKITQSGLFS